MLELLRNQIDVTRVPFSDRGSRLLVHQYANQNRLFIKLAERLISLEPGLETYLKRVPFIQDLYLVDSNGTELDFELTTFAEMLEFKTNIGTFRLVFQHANTLSFGLPQNTSCGIRFHVQTKTYQTIRNLKYATNGKIIKDKVSITETGQNIEFIVEATNDCVITLHISNEMNSSCDILPFSIAHENATKRWQAWFDRIPYVSEKYRQKYVLAWWVMANNLISPLGHIKYEAMMPTKAFYLGVWLWDSALHAIAFRHIDPELARDQLRVMLAHQLDDGMMPDAIFDEGVVSEIDHPIKGKVTKPPIMTWAALKIHEIDPNLDFLKEIYLALVKCTDWWFSSNYDDLAYYSHPYSSGLDNSPLWDYGMPVKSPDINTYLNIKMTSLARIAEILGLHDESALWRQRAASHLECMLKNLWDEETGLFKSLYNEQPIPVLTPFNLYPLWTGQLPEEITKSLVKHLKNPNEFYGKYMLPTVARNDSAYRTETMWRGPVWANINYFFVEALQKVGEIELACELRNKTLEMIMAQPGVHEYYNPETGEPPATSANMFGWTAAVFIELAIQASADSNQDI